MIRHNPSLASVRRVSLHYRDHSYLVLQSPPSKQIKIFKTTREPNALQIDAEADFEEE
jgi:hypothetical protein